MESKLKRIFRKLKSFGSVLRGVAKVSFSQEGEDIIINSLLERLHIKNPTYLDIGANEPIKFNNTYNMYLRGCRGTLVEPNAYLCAQLKSVRPNDNVLNYGIGSDNQRQADYYMFSNQHGVHNTFSKENAENTAREGYPIEKVVKLELKDINDVISENFKEAPTVISLDVEGLDEVILKKLNFEQHQPLIVCVETVDFSINKELTKLNSIIDYMASKNYFIYADTHLNTIFCSRKLFDYHMSKL